MAFRRQLSISSAAIALFGFAAVAAAETPAQPKYRTEIEWIDPVRDMPQEARDSHVSKVLFVNRCVGDCQLQPGSNDARFNTSSIIGGEPRTIAEFSLGDEVYNATIECLRDVYAPYDIQVVTDDPGDSMFHHEAILAGTAADIGRDARTLGLAPATCEPLNNVISFSFANAIGQTEEGQGLIETLCWTVAQESAHSFGLPNHALDCLDPMTYVDGCGRKFFKNDDLECADLNDAGQFVAMPCRCGGNRQNSHRELLATFGPGSTVIPPPSVNILFPANDAMVSDNDLGVFASATDPRLIDRVELWLNGTLYETKPGHPFLDADEAYTFSAPQHADGYIDIEVKAYSDIGVEGIAAITVLKGEPCTSPDQCFDNQSCNDGRCAYPPPSGEIGDDCEYDQFCLSGLCPERDGVRMCTRTCTVGVSGQCPEGFDCVEGGYCWDPDAGGGCCSVAGGQGKDDRFPLVVLGLFGIGMLFLRRRRV